MDITQPTGSIPPQVLTNTPITGGQTCLVDDPVHIVNDPNILTGGQSTPVSNMRIQALDNAPTVRIKQLR